MENIESFYPLSPMQQGMLFHTVHAPESAEYYKRLSCVLQGELNLAAFQNAWRHVIACHSVLRTAFLWEGVPQPVQVVHRSAEAAWDLHDLRALSPQQQECELQRLWSADARDPFQLSRAPLTRFLLVRTHERRYQFGWSFHHLILDGWSMAIVFRQALSAYGQLCRKEALPVHMAPPYRQFISWLYQQPKEQAEKFWSDYLAGCELPTPLRVDQKPALEPSRDYDRFDIAVPRECVARLQAFARTHRVTMSSILEGAWALLASRYSGQDDVVFGRTVSGRVAPLSQIESMTGLFINTVPARVSVDGGARLGPWLRQLQWQQAQVGPHEHTSLSDMKKWIGCASNRHLFDTLFVFENYPEASLAQEQAGLKIRPCDSFERTSVPLTILAALGKEINLSLIHDVARFSHDVIERMAGHYCTLLRSIPERGDSPLSTLSLLTAAEKHRVLVEWNDTATNWETHKLVPQLIDEQAQRTPDAVALKYLHRQLTYRELIGQANQLARYLSERGAGRETLVGICMERSVEMVVALLAVIKAGAAYVPLDPDYPSDRLKYMIEDAGVPLLLTQNHLLGRLSKNGAQVVAVDSSWEQISLNKAGPFSPHISPEDLVYVIYTSGSTGQPKGAMNTHRGLANRLLWMQREYGLNDSDRVLQKTPFSFDVSVWEFFWPLMTGAAIVVARPGGHRDSGYLVDLIRAERITTIHFVPSMLQFFLQESDLHGCQSLKRVICSGEALKPELQARFFSRLGCELHNLYGPTEASIDVTSWRCGPDSTGGSVPIGRPITNTRIYILDRDLNPAPVGVPGELYIGGVGLARGYWRRPELTKEKFIADPFSNSPGARLYKTGDLARFRPDGNIEYLGRLDSQVKIRGQRIELGEIESTIASHPEVQDSAVTLREDTPGESRLVAYVVPKANKKVSASELRRFLAKRLPEAMLPAAFVWLERMPLNANGKLDRRALAPPEHSRPEMESHYVAPRTPFEERITGIWSEVLKIDGIGIHDNFFELGGDSIAAMQTVSRMKMAGLGITTRQLFQHPTVAQLAEICSTAAKQDLVSQPSGAVPLTPIQRWFFEQQLQNPHHWNQAILLQPRCRLEPNLLRRALEVVGRQHDSLRLRFSNQNGQWRQAYDASAEPILFDSLDISSASPLEQNAAVEAEAAKLQSSLRIDCGPLARAALLDLGSSQRFVLVAHHLAIDGVSWRILLHDLQTAYRQISAGSEIKLPPRTSSFQSWAERLQALAKSSAIEEQTRYWSSLDWSEIPSLPIDSIGSNRERFSLTVWRSLPVDYTRSLLRDVNKAYRTQITDVLVTALVNTLSAWTGAQFHALELESHGREESFQGVDLSGTTGWFTSLYPVLLRQTATLAPGEALKSIKEQLRAVPAGGIAYGVARYLHGEGTSKLSSIPRAELIFNYLGQFDDMVSESSLFAETEAGSGPLHDPENARPHVLEVNCWIVNGTLRVGWTYSRELHRAESIARLADSFLLNLKGLIEHCSMRGTRGFTPSDFPLARLNQGQLDQITRTYPELEDTYVLSPMQQGMLFHTQYEPGGDLYFEQLACRLRGNLNVDAFEQAWDLVVNRHPALRTAFLWNQIEEPVQIVSRRVPVRFQREQWESLTWEEQGSRLAAYLEQDRKQAFDLSAAPLMRWALFQIGPGDFRFVWSWSHLLLDGWSLPLVWTEVLDCWRALSDGQKTTSGRAFPYRDYIEYVERQNAEEAEKFWRMELKGFSSHTPLPFETTRSVATARKRYVMERRHLSEADTAAIVRFARDNHVTLSTIVQGAWALLLSRYSGDYDVLFGSTFSGRPESLPGIESAVGLFINTLPVRVQVRPDQELGSWLIELQEHQLELRQFEYTPLVQIQSWSDAPAGSPLFESLVVFENYPLGSSVTVADVKVEDLQLSERSNYPLNLVVAPGHELLLGVVYDCDRFEARVVQHLLEHLKNLLCSMVSSSTQTLSALSPLGENERRRLLMDWNNTATDYPRLTIHQLFEQHAISSPERIAVTVEGKHLTYGQLNERANQLARYLVRGGVYPASLVGLCLDRSLEMIVSMLAILKIGGAYVPLDPEYPTERLRFMLEDMGTPTVLTTTRLMSALPYQDAKTVCIDRDWAAISAEAKNNPNICVDPRDLAYVIYTSGSTGRPKGVCVPHQAVVRLVKQTDYLSFSADEVFLHAAPTSFDAATFEIWGALLNQAQTVIAPKELVLRTWDFAGLLDREKITTLFLTTALFNQLVREQPAIFKGMKQVLFGGEKVEPHWVKQVLQHGPPERLVHVYGPTETTTFATWYQIETVNDDEPTIPIGRPISNTTVYVLNAQRELTPVGVPGELYIGGDGLAREYLNHPELTRERFVPHPFVRDPQARLYKTGDLVKYRVDGALEFLGRIDDQVKIRGFRIEPGEIEAVLARHAGVQNNVVLAREDVPGEKRLVAYVVPRHTPWPNVAEFRAYLKERLPEYMVPSAFVLLEQLPLSPNGKVDRRALAAWKPQNAQQSSTLFVPPQSDLERRVAAIWQQTIGIEKVGRDDNFFDLGGQSLLAARITSRIIDSFRIELPISAIFENPTVAEFSSVVERQLQSGTKQHTAVIRSRPREAFRVKPAQLTASADGKN